MAAPNEVLAKGCSAIDAYLSAYVKKEKIDTELAKLEQDSEDTISAMNGNQQSVVSCGLSGNARKYLEDAAIYQGNYDATMSDNSQSIIDYFTYIRSQQNQQSLLGAILYPNYGKSINVSGSTIIVQNI